MPEAAKFTQGLASDLLRRLRPVDVGVALRVHLNSALAERPPIENLLTPESRLFWLAAFVSYAQSQSHSGLSLDPSATLGDLLPEWAAEDAAATRMRLVDLVGNPEDLLGAFPAKVVEPDGLEVHPDALFVVRAPERLVYFHRWYALEAEVGAELRRRLSMVAELPPDSLQESFRQLFGNEEVKMNPWQAAACLSALRQRFAVITGGPGTGKTTTVTRLVALLLELPESFRPKDIRMVAPTGKAADRLREAFEENFDRLLAALPRGDAEALRAKAAGIQKPTTVHAFLGSRGLAGFSHHEGNPVSCDVLIVDEATMVDLELFAAIFRALPEECRVVLLGDRNQLTAVETGNVFSDLTRESRGGSLNAFSSSFRRHFAAITNVDLPADPEQRPTCGDSVTELVHSYRFSSDSVVGRLARFLFENERLPRVGEVPVEIVGLHEDWRTTVLASLKDYQEALRAGASPDELLEHFNSVRILCGVRRGDAGVDAVNRLAIDALLGAGAGGMAPRHGLPFMVVRNDRALGLWNGDCGVFAQTPTGALAAFVSGGDGGLRSMDPFALPDWEPAFAMTIHKSQGSEYERVVLVLPETRRPFITWELVYTGVTRAKRDVALIMPAATIGGKLARARRVSGLQAELA